MPAYEKAYLNEVVENQGKLFDFVAQAYVNTMDAQTLWDFFTKTDNYNLKPGNALEGFLPDWIGEFYAYYQWFYNEPSATVAKKIPVDFLIKAYPGLHDLELDLAVKKIGKEV